MGEEHQVGAPRDHYYTPLVSLTGLPSPLPAWSCPYCHCRCNCAGQFAGQEGKSRKSSSLRAGSVLRCAAAKFFKRLGRRHLSRKKSSQRSEPALNKDDHARELDCESLSELPPSIMNMSTELPDREPREPMELAGSVPPSNCSTGPPKLSGYYQQQNPGTMSELHGSTQDTRKPALKADTFIPVVDARVPAQSFTSDLVGNSGTTTTTTTQVPSMTSMSASMKRLVPDEKIVVMTHNSSRILTTPSYTSYNFDTRNGRQLKAASCVDHFARVVHDMYERWLNTSNDIFPSPDIETYFATCSPFETGIQVLRRCFYGVVPSTLSEIFHLVRIAVAAAYLLHHEEESYDWNLFFEHVLQWGEVIANTREKELFSTAVVPLYPPNWPKIIHSQISCIHHSSMASSQVNLRQKEAEQTAGVIPLIQGPACCECTQRSLSDATPNAIIQHLIQGPVINVCTQYLDCK